MSIDYAVTIGVLVTGMVFFFTIFFCVLAVFRQFGFNLTGFIVLFMATFGFTFSAALLSQVAP